MRETGQMHWTSIGGEECWDPTPVVDPWELRLGVTIAMDTDREVGGTTDGTAPVRTDCVSRAIVAPETCICVGGAVGLELVGAAVGVGFVSDIFACISP